MAKKEIGLIKLQLPGGAAKHRPSCGQWLGSLPDVVNVEGVHPGGGEIVHYDTDSGGAVFSVGSISYPSSMLVDDVISRITANVINRFLSS